MLNSKRPRTENRRGWIALIGAAAAVYAAFVATKSRKQSAGSVGAHAQLVPTRQARTEAHWTKNAQIHATESRHS